MQNVKDRAVVIAGRRKNRVAQEAERLSVSENHLKKLVRAGIIPAVKVGEI